MRPLDVFLRLAQNPTHPPRPWFHRLADLCAGDVLAAAAVLYTLGSVTIPSLASVYNELALKKHMDTSVHLQARP